MLNKLINLLRDANDTELISLLYKVAISYVDHKKKGGLKNKY